MPWIVRFAIGSLFVFVVGAVMIAWACMPQAGKHSVGLRGVASPQGPA